jgi:hypothetical protein
MIEPGSFREATRTVTVSYPIPFLVATLLAFGLGCFGGALAAWGPLRWVFVGIGAFTALIAIGLAVYAVLHKPDLLRSERYSLFNRYFDMLGDAEMDQAARDAAGKTILGFIEPAVPKHARNDRSGNTTASNEDGDD